MSAAPKIPNDETPKPQPVSDYAELELKEPLVNTALRDRRGQRVLNLRRDEDVYFKDHPAGVEVCGKGAWRGVVPWANIKMAKR